MSSPTGLVLSWQSITVHLTQPQALLVIKMHYFPAEINTTGTATQNDPRRHLFRWILETLRFKKCSGKNRSFLQILYILTVQPTY